MCDTLCVLGDGVTLFAKNSDRPVTEAQVFAWHPSRDRDATRLLRTQYLELADDGAAATLLSQPVWLWGAEHGVNEHGVAIGNEMVDTTDDPTGAPPALIGMDLVRLGLERATSADDALEVMTGLLDRHGQGGVCDQVHGTAYWSSFLVADPSSAWVLETSGRRWAARPVRNGDAISNRLTLRRDWTRASPGVAPDTDVDSWRNHATHTGFADGRLDASRAFLARTGVSTSGGAPRTDARAAVAHLRDHGSGPWGAPGDNGAPVPPPLDVLPDGTGVTVCMHIRDFEATTASLVVELPADHAGMARAWAALGSPCSSVYVPVLLPASPGRAVRPVRTDRDVDAVVPASLGSAVWWHRFAAVARDVEKDSDVLAVVRALFGPLESDLWDEADVLGSERERWRRFASGAERRVGAALDRLARSGIGVDRGASGHDAPGAEADRPTEAHR
jgi:hypothetical protein